MNNPQSFAHADLERAVARLRLGVSASELHGSLSGYLCAGGTSGAGEDWLQVLQLEHDDVDHGGAARREMNQLALQTQARLDDPGLGFTPLMPADESNIVDRARALVDWCRGFLGGLGLAGLPGELPPTAAEIMHDFARIATTSDSFEDEDDEAALIELVEFVRVGALLLRDELEPPPRPDGARSR